jgi:hypothetical protein
MRKGSPMREQIDFRRAELREVADSLREIEASIGAQLGAEIVAFIKEIEGDKEDLAYLTLKISRLEKLNNALHDLELRYGISLGQTIYHFMHSFHQR